MIGRGPQRRGDVPRGGFKDRLQLLQILDNVWAGPVGGEDELAASHAVAIDDGGFRIAGGAIQVVAFLGRVEHGHEINAIFTEEGMILVILGIYSHADHNDFIGHALLQSHQRRHFRNARRAVRRPEIQDHDLAFAAVVMQRDGVVRICDSEVRGFGADHADAGLLGAAGKGGSQNGQKQESQGFHTLIITRFQ